MISVLTIAIDYLPNLGGISNHIYNLHHSLLKNNIKSQILQIIEDSTQPHNSVVKEDDTLHRWHIKDKLNRFTAAKYKNELNHILQNIVGPIDIIHTHEMGNTEFLLPVCNVKWVWTNHTSRFYDIFQSNLNWLNLIRKVLYKAKFKQADAVICVSKQLESISSKVVPDRSMYIPNGIDFEFYKCSLSESVDVYSKYGIPRDKFIIFVPARWAHVKGIHLIPQILNILTKVSLSTYGDIHFVFAGAGIGEATYSKHVRAEMSRHQNATIIDRVEYDQMPHLYNAANLTFLPSLHENTSISILEAMASKSIVLASSAGGTVELISDSSNGFLFRTEDAQDASRKIIKLLRLSRHCPEELEGIRQRASQMVEMEYGWMVVSKNIISLYNQIVYSAHRQSTRPVEELV